MTGGSKRWLVALLVVGLVLAAGWWLLGPVSPPKGVTLSDLGGVDQLKTRFNEDVGATRLVVILSPT